MDLLSSIWASHGLFFSKPRFSCVETIGVAPQVQAHFHNWKGGDSVSRFDWTGRFLKNSY
jgi:hypothetical protein